MRKLVPLLLALAIPALAIPAFAIPAFAVPAAADAATLRPATRLAGPMVLLSDLFDDAGEQASRPLGASPGPGERLVVLAPQLAAIARQLGVDWRPSSPGDRVTLERPGAPLPEALVTDALRTALSGAGGGDLDMPGFASPLVPDGTALRAVVEQLSFQSDTQRFTAGVAVTGAGMDTLHLRLSGRLVATVEVPVALHVLVPGVPIGPDDVRLRKLRVTAVPADAARAIEAIVGLVPRRTLADGAPLPQGALMRPAAVTRGDRVAISLSAPGILLAGGGQAIDGGALGDTISVLNPTSRAVLRAVVIGPDSVRVEPGSVPRLPGHAL